MDASSPSSAIAPVCPRNHLSECHWMQAAKMTLGRTASGRVVVEVRWRPPGWPQLLGGRACAVQYKPYSARSKSCTGVTLCRWSGTTTTLPT